MTQAPVEEGRETERFPRRGSGACAGGGAPEILRILRFRCTRRPLF